MAPRAGERGQAGDRAHGVAAAAHALHAVVQADRRRTRRAPVARQRADLFRRDAADVRGALRAPAQRALAQCFPAQRVLRDVVVVQPVVRDQLVHQRQRQRRVGAGAQLDVLVAFLGRVGAARVDAHQPGAVSLGRLRDAPEVQVAGDRIAAPDQDQLRFGEELHLHADLAAQRLHQAFGAGAGTDRAIEQRSAQLVEEARGDAFGLHQPHRARVAVRHDGLGIARGDRLQPAGDVVQRLVPADRLESARAFRSGAAQGLQYALGVVGALGVARHLGAQRAVGVGMLRVAADPDGDAVLHRREQRAGVGAIVRAGAANDMLAGFRQADARGDADGAAHVLTL